MTWASGQCLQCHKRIPQRQKQAEFCSSDCASEYRKQDSAERHGVAPRVEAEIPEVPESVRAVAKSLAVTQRIRKHVDANVERRRTPRPPAQPAGSEPSLANELALQPPAARSIAESKITFEIQMNSHSAPQFPRQSVASAICNPEMTTDLRPLGNAPRRPAPVNLLGAFAFFPIGDLALIAPVELPGPLENVLAATPQLNGNLRLLRRPDAVVAASPMHAGLQDPLYEIEGQPKLIDLVDPKLAAARSPGASFRRTSTLPLTRPSFRDPSSSIARLSQRDEMIPLATPEAPIHVTQESQCLQLATGKLEFHFLALETYSIRTAGAQLVSSAPLRATSFPGAPVEVPDSNLDLVQPAWQRGIPIAIPGLVPPPRDHKRVIRELAPWFVPSRPKPPMAALSILETPTAWKHVRQAVAPQVTPVTEDKVEPATELAALATALDGATTRSESPWPQRRRLPVITPIADWWLTCSNQVRVVVIALPLLFAVALKPLTHGSAGAPSMEDRPTAPIHSAHADPRRQGLPGGIPSVPPDLEARVENATKSQFDGVKQSIVSRAAVEMADDFQSGLDNWEGNSQLGPSWSYDRTGFIRPRALGIYRPSMGLSDYAFEFLGKIDQRSLSWVFRASDLNNYYAMKLVDKTGGVTPQMVLVHYAVIEGREGPKKEVPLPITVYKDTLFRIRMDIQGPHFSVQVQGTVVDYWKDPRLKAGGIGFFAGRGDESRVRWVQVTHHDDMLGKLCAFLAPYAM